MYFIQHNNELFNCNAYNSTELVYSVYTCYKNVALVFIQTARLFFTVT